MGNDVEARLKSFWEKPEGRTGIIALGALLFGGFIGFTKILPWLIMIASNTLYLIFLLVAIGGILFLITNPRVRALAWVSFQLIMKRITSFIVKTDPLAILKLRVQEMQDNLEKMGESLSKLNQNKARLKMKIDKNESGVQQEMERASYAKKKSATEEVYLSTRQAGRLQKSNLTLKDLYTKIETMLRVLTKIHKNSAVVIADTKNEIDVTEEEYRSVKEAHSAMKSAMSILNGNKDKRAIYEEAYEVLYNEIAEKSGDLQQMLEMSESFMNNIDLEQGMLQEKGMDMLSEWEKKADAWLTNSTQKSDAVSEASGQPLPIHKLSPVLEEVAENTTSQFGNLFNKNI